MGITFWCLVKNVPFDGPFRRIFSDAPRNGLTGVSALVYDYLNCCIRSMLQLNQSCTGVHIYMEV